MAYKALYRTYRPKDFEEIAGQEHITRTFKNALKNNKIAHAYLFSGPRGTGKTSIAKIIAKAVNCEQAPVSNPCNNCEICKGIDSNVISDVIEIDAASNNGVDEIREIRDKVKYLPGVGKYKVYIIDEVHMLSQGAFNALLKTLEEPPKHVIFILATTEPHKIPATIHSRCQRFDFRGVSVPEMITRMKTIIEEETISISSEAIKVIAESAEGGMRDAISLLDQVVSYTDQKVSVDDVHAIRGTVSNEKLLGVAYAIYENDSVQAIKLLDELISLGKEAQRLVENLIKFYRDLLIFKNTNTSDLEHLLFENEKFQKLSNQLNNNMIFFYIDVLNKAQNDMKYTNNAKLYMELALIKMVDKVEKQEIVIENEFLALKKELSNLRKEIENIEITPIVKTTVDKVEQVKPQTTTEEVFLEEDTLEEDSYEINYDESEDDSFEVLPEELYEDENINTDSYDNFENEVSDEELDENIEEEEEFVEEPINEPEEEQGTDLFSLPIQEEPVKKEEPYSTYDIRIVEDVLNNGDREVKIKINNKWFDIERNIDPKDLQYAKLITSGRLVATNGKTLIISYPNPSTCNRMMEVDIKEKVKSILTEFHEIDLDYMALPVDVWENVSAEFLAEWRKDKNRVIKLSPISHPGLKDIKLTKQPIDDFTPDSVKEAMQLFGRENVKVKKGE